MLTEFYITILYITPLFALILIFRLNRRGKAARAQRIFALSVEEGLTEPASLHPVIDNSRCLGCATCVAACPEKEVLGIVHMRAKLIKPASCIGHGACKTACPTNAIQLVFGTATRGVDIPTVGEDFQTNVPGIYVAGELGGMGLIRNAIEQGRQAMMSVASNSRRSVQADYDVVVIGAGPAGISAAMCAKELGMTYKVLEQDTVGGTIAHYPRGKVVMTQPATLPIVGEFQFSQTTKEDLMKFWQGTVAQAELDIVTGAAVEAIEQKEDFFVVKNDVSCTASNVLLAIGRRGSPRKLGVPGEELSKVIYRLIDPAQYKGRKVMVVGGGDSALEAAVSLAEEPGTEVVLSYRNSAFNRAKARNRELVSSAEGRGNLKVELASQLLCINADTVLLETEQGESEIENDIVLVCAGGILPTAFLQAAGVQVETRFGTA